jgi:hypothetical protein
VAEQVLSRFEEGKPADPTEAMSPEDKAEWEKQTEAHKDQFKTAAVDKAKVKKWMKSMVDDHVDRKTDEVNTTSLAEGAAHEFDHDEWLDDSNHWVWDLSMSVGNDYEREHKQASDKTAFGSSQELRELEELLAVNGYDPDEARKLQYEGMGPYELEHILKTTRPGGVGSLEYTHRIKRLRNAAHSVLTRFLTADQDKAAPEQVDKYFKQVKKDNPSYDDSQAYATAWSIYCKHKNPGSDSCHQDDYLTGKTAGVDKSKIKKLYESYAAKNYWGDDELIEGRLTYAKQHGLSRTPPQILLGVPFDPEEDINDSGVQKRLAEGMREKLTAKGLAWLEDVAEKIENKDLSWMLKTIRHDQKVMKDLFQIVTGQNIKSLSDVKLRPVLEAYAVKTAGVTAVRKPKDTFEKHQLKVLLDTVRNPMKSLLGGPDAEEAEDTLRDKFQYTDAEIRRLKQGKTAGYSYSSAPMTVLFVDARKPVPFNIDTIQDINHTTIPIIGDDGEEHDVELKVVGHQSSGPLTQPQEKQGWKREVRVDIQHPVDEGGSPQTSARAALTALVQVGKKHGFKVEPVQRGYKPETRKASLNPDPAMPRHAASLGTFNDWPDWLKKAKTKDAVVEIKNGDVIWESGTWESGTWEKGTWKDGDWYNGTWKDGVWEKGTWYNGTRQEGTWLDGTWKNGIWESGIWESGTWEKGTWKEGIWQDGTWNGGDWGYGDWHNGDWHNGTWHNGIWYKGLWKEGTWENGDWYNGTWERGTWWYGTWEDGVWKDGDWYNGTWKDGVWKKGTWYNGTWQDGTWNGGDWGYGDWHNGDWHNGTWHNGTWLDGTWKNGVWKNGIWESGIWESGTWQDGTWNGGDWGYGDWHNGTWHNGTWENGTWHNGVWKNGTWKNGTWIAGKRHLERRHLRQF